MLQLGKLKIPTAKDMRHIDRKLKSCWDPSSKDEYVLLIPLICFSSLPYEFPYMFAFVSVNRSKKREKKSKHKSKRTAAEVQGEPA